MSRVTPDRPLTDAQERLLIALADADYREACSVEGRTLDSWELPKRQWHPTSYLPGKPDHRTRACLERLGLIERGPGESRLTEAGVAMLRSMGD